MDASSLYWMCCSSLRGRYPTGPDKKRSQSEKRPTQLAENRIDPDHHHGRHVERPQIEHFANSVKAPTQMAA